MKKIKVGRRRKIERIEPSDGRKETHVKVLQSNFGAGKTF
jgi:hypothetical protein